MNPDRRQMIRRWTAASALLLLSGLLTAAAQSPVADNPRTSEAGSASQSAASDVTTPPGETSGTTATPPVSESRIPLPHRPYTIAVEVGFSGDITTEAILRSAMTEDIRNGLHRMYGAMWNATVQDSDWLIPADSDRLRRITEAEVMSHYEGTPVEKVILIAVSRNSGTCRVACREMDLRIQELSPLMTESTTDEHSVSQIACRLARDSFRPFLMLSGPSVDKTELEFELQAGMIIPPDPSAAQIQEGDVLRTFIRQMERRIPGKVKILQRLDLCYIRVTEFNEELRSDLYAPEDLPVRVDGVSPDSQTLYVNSGHVRGVLISHGPVPFGGRGRTMQQIAIRQRPSASSSRVRMVLQQRPDRPLICHRVDLVAKLRQTDVNETPATRVLSDRNGDIEIDVDPENPTFWLYVYSGSILLARVPYAPGLIPQDLMKLPDDSIRLGVEGELYLFRDQLVDMVAQKAVYMSLAKKAAAEGNVAGLESAIRKLDELPGQRRFEELLNRIRTNAVNKAKQQRNASAQRRVESLCTKMGESLTAFFGTDKRLREATELERLRQSAEARAAVTEAP